jgi:hypothetical protein
MESEPEKYGNQKESIIEKFSLRCIASQRAGRVEV